MRKLLTRLTFFAMTMVLSLSVMGVTVFAEELMVDIRYEKGAKHKTKMTDCIGIIKRDDNEYNERNNISIEKINVLSLASEIKIIEKDTNKEVGSISIGTKASFIDGRGYGLVSMEAGYVETEVKKNCVYELWLEIGDESRTIPFPVAHFIFSDSLEEAFEHSKKFGDSFGATFVEAVPANSSEQPAAPISTASASQDSSAAPTASKVYINGKDVSFEAYNIDGSNYFKLRDLAYSVNGTDKQFDVSWDGAANAINLLSNNAYTVTSGEMSKGDGNAKPAQATTSKILLDGMEIQLTAYNIGGNNYFKLRDIGKAFNFAVDWDGVNNAIQIDTSKPYTE